MSDPLLQAFSRFFRFLPEPHLLLRPDLTIVQANDAYLRATMTRAEQIVGRPMFDAFPDDSDDASATGVANLRASLARVIATGLPDAMPVQKYDVRRPAERGGFEERHWTPLNLPWHTAARRVRKRNRRGQGALVRRHGVQCEQG